MPIDLMKLAKEALGGGLIDQLAVDLAETPEVTLKAVDAGIPAVLGGLLGKLQNSGGVDDIMGALDEDDDGLLSNLGGTLFGGSQSGLLARGASLVAMIYGAKQGGVLGSIAKMVGMRNASGATKVMGMLAPIVMGFIRKQRAADNLDAVGVQNLLSDQKDFIADKLPMEMRSSLGIADLFESANGTTPRLTAVPPVPPVQTEKVASETNWLPWALAAAVALLAFLFWPSEDKTDPVEAINSPQSQAVTREPSFPTGDVDLGNMGALVSGLTERLSGLTDKLATVSDLGSARELAGELGDTNTYLDALNLDSLPEAARGSLSSSLGSTVDKLESAATVAYKIPGVQNLLEPMVSPLLERLRGF